MANLKGVIHFFISGQYLFLVFCVDFSSCQFFRCFSLNDNTNIGVLSATGIDTFPELRK